MENNIFIAKSFIFKARPLKFLENEIIFKTSSNFNFQNYVVLDLYRSLTIDKGAFNVLSGLLLTKVI